MIIDGKKIATELKLELKKNLSDRKLCLAIILVGIDPVMVKFVAQKQKIASELGVEMKVWEFPIEVLETDLVKVLDTLSNDNSVQGILIQLPLPTHLNTKALLNLIPAQKDVDALSENASVESPVVLAIWEILNRQRIDLIGKKILVVGQGQLVGRPIAINLAQAGFEVETADVKTTNLIELTRQADVIISGVGKPGLIKPDMVKAGAVLIDCGTSEQAGQLKGDLDPACADKASLFTPVPGGIGPIMVLKLFENLKILNNG